MPSLLSFFNRLPWRWWVCGLLLLASMVNYMDRLTINLLNREILDDLDLTKLHYARIESGFAVAFALGAILFGFIVDRWNVYWVYPLAVLAWSAAGFCTGFATGFLSLLFFRFLLGLAESANWPCALRTTQRILPPEERAMGNSILQAGVSVGAVLLPQLMKVMFDPEYPETWRRPFLLVGAFGAIWVVFWWSIVRPKDLSLTYLTEPAKAVLPPSLPRPVFIRRFAVLIVLVIAINMTWHFMRAWLPVYLRDPERGYSFKQTNDFITWYYICTDIGALAAGGVALWLARRGVGVHRSRSLVFLLCALLAGLCAVIPWIPPGPWLVALCLIIGFGTLGMFPSYYSFSQDLTVRHQGKVTGTLGFCCWIALAAWHELVGQLEKSVYSYTPAFLIAGAVPLVSFVVLATLWGTDPEPEATAGEPTVAA